MSDTTDIINTNINNMPEEKLGQDSIEESNSMNLLNEVENSILQSNEDIIERDLNVEIKENENREDDIQISENLTQNINQIENDLNSNQLINTFVQDSSMSILTLKKTTDESLSETGSERSNSGSNEIERQSLSTDEDISQISQYSDKEKIFLEELTKQNDIVSPKKNRGNGLSKIKLNLLSSRSNIYKQSEENDNPFSNSELIPIVPTIKSIKKEKKHREEPNTESSIQNILLSSPHSISNEAPLLTQDSLSSINSIAGKSTNSQTTTDSIQVPIENENSISYDQSELENKHEQFKQTEQEQTTLKSSNSVASLTDNPEKIKFTSRTAKSSYNKQKSTIDFMNAIKEANNAKIKPKHSYKFGPKTIHNSISHLDRFNQIFGKDSKKSNSQFRKNFLTLTFKDWNIEKKFTHSMYGSFYWRQKVVLLGMILINAIFVFVDVFQLSVESIGTWPYYTNISLRAFTIIFGLVHYPFIWKPKSGHIWIEYFTVMPMLAFLVCTSIQSIITSNEQNNRFPIGAVIIIISMYILPRIRSIIYYPLSAIVIFTYVAGMFLIHSAKLVPKPLPLGRIIVFCLIIVIAVIISFVLTYMDEFYLRYVFILTEKLQKETDNLREEKERSQTLLENIIPSHLAKKVKTENTRFLHLYFDISILFSDLVEFTKFSSTVTAEELISILNRQFSCFDELCLEYRLEKIKTVGDAFFALGGSSGTGEEHTADCIGLGLSMVEALNAMNEEYGWEFKIRIGVACGTGLVTVLGKEKLTFDVFGRAVSEGELMEQSSPHGRVHVTDAVYKRTSHFFEFEESDPIKGRLAKTYLAVKEKPIYLERKFTEIVIEEIPYSPVVESKSNAYPIFLDFSQGVFETLTPELQSSTFAQSEGSLFKQKEWESHEITTNFSQKVKEHRKQNHIEEIHFQVKKKVVSIQLQILDNQIYIKDEMINKTLNIDKIEETVKEKPKPLSLNRIYLLFDRKTTLSYIRQTYKLRRGNLKYIFILLLIFNIIICGCMVAIFPEFAFRGIFIAWYCILLLSLIVTILFLFPFLAKYFFIGAMVCFWFVLTSVTYLFFLYFLPFDAFDQLIGLLGCWALLALNIFPNIPFIVKVFINIPLTAITILIHTIYVVFYNGKNGANPFLYVSMIIQMLIQIFGSYVSELNQANVFILRRNQKIEKANIQIEQQKNNMVIQSVLPVNIVDRLKTGGENVHRPFVSDFIHSGSILFAEFYGFGKEAIIEPVIAIGILNDLFSLFDTITVRNHSFKIKSIGGTYLAVSGLNNESSHAIALSNTALEIRNESRKLLASYKKLISAPKEEELGVRIGCHSGPFSCGVVGETKYLYDTFGDSINKTARLKSSSEVGKILCSQELYEATKNNFDFKVRGEIHLKGKGNTMTYWLLRSLENIEEKEIQTEFEEFTPVTAFKTNSTPNRNNEVEIESLRMEIAELRLINAEQNHELSQLRGMFLNPHQIQDELLSEDMIIRF